MLSIRHYIMGYEKKIVSIQNNTILILQKETFSNAMSLNSAKPPFIHSIQNTSNHDTCYILLDHNKIYLHSLDRNI